MIFFDYFNKNRDQKILRKRIFKLSMLFSAFVMPLPLESLKWQPQLPVSMFENDPCHSTRVEGNF